ncbi:MAG TPA: YkgJ family cysteine cluster protein [Candidatus Thermoplasmatota archaeon]|nr:YkgJ family cysteine cluster protein [Candidatus Thermoplasmatota archaeon]
MNIEASELQSNTFRCLPGCGFCCLCPAGLSPTEAARLRSDPRTRPGVADGQEPSLKLAGGNGACVFLASDRACSIYDERPRPCRAFPYSTHVLERAQVSINRACPGTWTADAPPALAGLRAEEFLPNLEARVAEARSVFEAFRSQAQRRGLFATAESVRNDLKDVPASLDLALLLGALCDLDAGRVVRRDPPSPADPKALARVRMALVRAAFAAKDGLSLPIRVAPDLSWETWRLQGLRIQRLRLGASGRTEPLGELRVSELDWLPADEPAAALARAYAATLLARDHLYGLACHGVDAGGYQAHVARVFEHEFWNALADVWLRASAIARAAGRDRLDADGMRQGIAFFDMDFLDSPTIGAVL